MLFPVFVSVKWCTCGPRSHGNRRVDTSTAVYEPDKSVRQVMRPYIPVLVVRSQLFVISKHSHTAQTLFTVLGPFFPGAAIRIIRAVEVDALELQSGMKGTFFC